MLHALSMLPVSLIQGSGRFWEYPSGIMGGTTDMVGGPVATEPKVRFSFQCGPADGVWPASSPSGLCRRPLDA
jgi:hypothetical protein